MTSTSERETQDHSADYYLQRYRHYGLKYHTQIIQWLTSGLISTQRGLDVGCGIGIIEERHRELQLTGIDLSPRMIELATLQLGKTQGEYTVGDVCHMPEEWTGQFDYILCRSLLHHLPDHWRGLQEMARVLKPGGQIRFWETNQSWLATLIRHWTQHGDRFSAYHHSFKDTALLKDIGHFFTILEVAYQGFFCYPLYGFPDILNFAYWVPGNPLWYSLTWKLDAALGRLPWVKRHSFAIGIKAIKPTSVTLLS